MSVSRHTAHGEDSVRLKRRLRDELRRLRLRLAGHAALMLTGGIGLLLAAAVISSRGWMSLGPIGAWGVWIGVGLASAWLLYFELLMPLRRISNLRGFSHELERHGDYQNLLEAATQFTSPRKGDPLRLGASPELVAEILHRACEQAERTALAPRIPLVGVGLHLALAVAALLSWLILGAADPGAVRHATASLLSPARLAEHPPSSGLFSLSGDLRIPVGDDVELLARDLIGGQEKVLLQLNWTGEFWQEESTQLLTVTPNESAYLDRTARVRRVEDPFRYRFRKGELYSPVYEVAVKERPVLRSLSARLEPPAYTGEAPSEREDLGGTVAVLEGTRVSLSGRASVRLGAAHRLIEGQAPIPLEVGGDGFEDELTVDQEISFRIALTDDEGLSGEAATVYRFVPIPDDPPTVSILSPGQDLVLDRDLNVSIAGLAADDVGLARVDLLYRADAEIEWSRISLVLGDAAADAPESIEDLEIEPGERELALAFRWNLGDQTLFPGDALSYCLEAVDNNALAGGQSARSSIYRLRLPTVAEVFELQKDDRGESRDELSEILEKGEELEDTFERLSRELKKNPQPDWAKQQEIQEALKAQKQLQEEVDGAAGELQRMLDEFQNNNSGSLETMEKMEIIQELIDELQDENLEAYLEAMQEAMDQLSPQEIQRAMEEAQNSQEEYNRRLDRTIELLRQLERERTMGDLVEEVSEYLSRQEELREITDGEEDSEESGEGEETEGGEDEGGEESGESDSSESEGEESDQSSEGEDSESSDASESQEGEQQDGEQHQGESQEGSEESPEQSGEESASEEAMTEEQLARAQEQLEAETKALEERLKEALEELKAQKERGEADDASAEEMRKALEEAMERMEQQGEPSESMKGAKEQLSQGEREEASQQQQQAMDRLTFLYQVLSEGQTGMMQASAQFAVEKLQQTAYDLLRVSFEEEQVVGLLQGGVKGQQLQPITRRQARLLRGTEGLSEDLHELSRKNFMIPEKLLASMRDLVSAMEETVQQMEYTRPRRARDDASASMGLMNRIVIGLLTAAQNQGQGGGGGGDPSQQMQQLAGDQARLNAMTQEMRKKLQGGLSPEERRQLAEMRAQQQALRQRLAEIQKGIEDQRKVLGNLDKIGEDMEKVARELDTGRLSGETRDLQEKILSRLLDAQRSVREREFAKRRESEGGQELFGEQEGSQLADGKEDRERQLRSWLAPDKAPHAYQDDVRRYFRRIQGELEKGGSRP